MGIIIVDYDTPDERNNILPFPADDLAPPPCLTTREVVRAIIGCSPAHRRAVEEGRSRQFGLEGTENAAAGLESGKNGYCDENQNGDLCQTMPPTPTVRVLPRRNVPDSCIDNRPTINTAVRAVMPSEAEIAQAERATRRLNGDE